jgi:hypothetical protein
MLVTALAKLMFSVNNELLTTDSDDIGEDIGRGMKIRTWLSRCCLRQQSWVRKPTKRTSASLEWHLLSTHLDRSEVACSFLMTNLSSRCGFDQRV